MPKTKVPLIVSNNPFRTLDATIPENKMPKGLDDFIRRAKAINPCIELVGEIINYQTNDNTSLSTANDRFARILVRQDYENSSHRISAFLKQYFNVVFLKDTDQAYWAENIKSAHSYKRTVAALLHAHLNDPQMIFTNQDSEWLEDHYRNCVAPNRSKETHKTKISLTGRELLIEAHLDIKDCEKVLVQADPATGKVIIKIAK